MSYKEFLKVIELQMRERIGEGATVMIHQVVKNNSVVLDGLSILEKGDNISPAIYLNRFYQEYLTGETMEKIISKILFCYYQGKKINYMDTSFYTEVSQVRQRIVCRVIGREKNRRLLEEIPYRTFMNLAIVYYYLLDQKEIGTAAILIKKAHLKMWGLDEEKLYEIAKENMVRLLPWEFLNLKEMMQSFLEKEIEMEETENPLYVLTNVEKSYGAVWMTDPVVLETIADRLQRNYYILPSSVHECMIVPEEETIGWKMLLEMVQEINATQVEPEEVLADTVYYYEKGTKRLCMFEDGTEKGDRR